MTTPNRWAVREVALATFYDLSTNKAILHLEDLKTSGLENSADSVYARGGRGNAKIVGFSSNREAKVTLESALFDNQAMAMMTGNNLATGAEDVYQRDALTVTTDAASLTKTPADSKLISLYRLNGDGSHGEELTLGTASPTTGEYFLAGKELTFATDDFVDGDMVVAYYMVTTDTTASVIKVTSDKFAGSYKLVLDCLVRDAFTKKDYAAQIVIFNCKAEDNWSFSLAADGDPSTFSMPIEVLKSPSSSDMWQMTVYDDTAIA